MIKIRLVRLLSHAKKYIIYNVIWQWIALLTQIAAVLAIANLLEKIIFFNTSLRNIQITAIVLILTVIIRFICEQMGAKTSYLASVDVKRILRQKIYQKLLCLGSDYQQQISTSEVVQLCTEGVEQLETYFGKYLSQLFYSLLAPITLFCILSFINLKASLVLLICVPLIPLSIIMIQKIAKKLLSKYWGIYASLGDSFLENLQGLTTLKIYQADEQKAVQMDKESQNFRKITMKVLTMQLNSTSIMDIIAYGGAAIGMIVAAREYLLGNINFAGTLTIILLAAEFFIPLRLLGSFFHIAMNGMAASDKIFHLLDLEVEATGTEKLPEGPLDIQLSNVRFSYEKNREILKDINIDLSSGTFVSLVGKSGCGKSTIANLLSGKNRNFKGEILIGGKPIEQIDRDNLMKHITIIRHNSYLFKGTVAQNLKMAKPNATKSEMETVLKKVNLLSFLNAKQGLETPLMERASNFSGGQCQRLALARALLNDTPIYVFDEATSNIDVESEELIMNVIYELAKTKTVLLISHRLSNVIKADCIYMVIDGEIKEQGTHKQLLSQNGNYKHLFESQRKLEQYREVV